MTSPIKTRMRSELEGKDKELLDLSIKPAELLTETLTDYVNSLPAEKIELINDKISFFVYNTLLLFVLHELYQLNILNSISLDDALSNVDVMNNSLKQMLTNAWNAIEDARNPNKTEH